MKAEAQRLDAVVGGGGIDHLAGRDRHVLPQGHERTLRGVLTDADLALYEEEALGLIRPCGRGSNKDTTAMTLT